jgi:hypothetical protein
MSTSDPIFAVWGHSQCLVDTRGTRSQTHLKGDMVVPNPNLELLLADDVLLRPVRVILPVHV